MYLQITSMAEWSSRLTQVQLKLKVSEFEPVLTPVFFKTLVSNVVLKQFFRKHVVQNLSG